MPVPWTPPRRHRGPLAVVVQVAVRVVVQVAAVALVAAVLGLAAAPRAAAAPPPAPGAPARGVGTAPVVVPSAAAGWGWPLAGRPAVVAAFQPPPAPWLAGHRGVDLAGAAGEPVLAAGSGVVAFAGSVAGIPVVSVDHPGGLRTTYEPVVATVRRGDGVHRGEVLGTLAAVPSHCSPLACLHWGLRRGRTYLDPLALLGLDLRVRLLPVWDR